MPNCSLSDARNELLRNVSRLHKLRQNQYRSLSSRLISEILPQPVGPTRQSSGPALLLDEMAGNWVPRIMGEHTSSNSIDLWILDDFSVTGSGLISCVEKIKRLDERL